MAQRRVLRNWTVIAWVAVLAVRAGLEAARNARADGVWSEVLNQLIVVLGVAVFVAILAWFTEAHYRRAVRRIARRRPGARVVLSYALPELREAAARLGSVPRRPRWSYFAVVTVTPANIELWATRDVEPRCRVARDGATFSIEPVDMLSGSRMREVEGLWIESGSASLVLVPAPPSALVVRRKRLRAEMQRALDAFECEPSIVPGFA